MALLLCPEGRTKSQSKGSLSSSEANLKIIGDPGCSWCVYANRQAELKVGLKVVSLITMRVILRRKIMV